MPNFVIKYTVTEQKTKIGTVRAKDHAEAMRKAEDLERKKSFTRANGDYSTTKVQTVKEVKPING